MMTEDQTPAGKNYDPRIDDHVAESLKEGFGPPAKPWLEIFGQGLGWIFVAGVGIAAVALVGRGLYELTRWALGV